MLNILKHNFIIKASYLNTEIIALKMVKQANKNNKNYYICEECDFAYSDNEIASKCEDWCKKHHSCNMEITKYAINL